jgi:hypothetical protein
MILLMDHSTAADDDLVSISLLETPNPTTEESLDITRSTVNVERILNHSPLLLMVQKTLPSWGYRHVYIYARTAGWITWQQCRD